METGGIMFWGNNEEVENKVRAALAGRPGRGINGESNLDCLRARRRQRRDAAEG